MMMDIDDPNNINANNNDDDDSIMQGDCGLLSLLQTYSANAKLAAASLHLHSQYQLQQNQHVIYEQATAPAPTDFQDERVFCPKQLLSGTNLDLGECPKIHSEILREQYIQAVKSSSHHGYAVECRESLREFLNTLDQRIATMRRVLKRNSAAGIKKIKEIEALTETIDEKYEVLMVFIQKLTMPNAPRDLTQSEAPLDRSHRLLKELEELQRKRKELESEVQRDREQISGIKVCDVCGCFISDVDVGESLASHRNGKIHKNIKNIRDQFGMLEQARLIPKV
ncbi:hypothetical protein HDU76_001007 [Blyttiomyces sp. JEL0837]|nr:hypothetical protein HDU76_001007 [Blyttiomyces sp. JEL0837]